MVSLSCDKVVFTLMPKGEIVEHVFSLISKDKMLNPSVIIEAKRK